MESYDIALADALLMQVEGCRLHPYVDSSGVPTIGIGCRFLADGSPVTMQTPPLRDQAEALDLMTARLATTVQDVRGLILGKHPDHQMAALYSFTYNEGARAFSGSALLHFLNEDAGESVIADQFRKWEYAHDPHTHLLVRVPGLAKRRAIERACFLGLAIPRVNIGA